MNKNLLVYRIRKVRPDGRIAKGVGLRLANHFKRGNEDNQITSLKPSKRIPDNSVIWNYGQSKIPAWLDDALGRGCQILNHPASVANSVDKRKSLAIFKEREIPSLDFTTYKVEAERWLEYGFSVIVRATPSGKKGDGVSLVHPGEELPDAPLYTLFYDKTHEFRVHIVGGRVVDFVMKKRMGKEKRSALGLEEADHVVRNHKRGWVFAHKDILDHPVIRDISIRAAKECGLDICATDVLARFNKEGHFLDARVCEVNSSPGMSSPTTFEAYTKAVEEMYLTEPSGDAVDFEGII